MDYLAAIDIGSNAMRLAIAHPTSQGLYISYKTREPVRLGSSVFESGKVEPLVYEKLEKSIIKFCNQMKNYKVQSYRAVATSAMRDAKNQKKIIAKIKQNTGVKLEVITGEEESRLVAIAIQQKMNLNKGRFLLIDIGGGSIELIAMDNGSIQKKESLPLGTVRLLQLSKKRPKEENFYPWLKKYICKKIIPFFYDLKPFEAAVGIGGNMDRFVKLKSFVGSNEGMNLTLNELTHLDTMLKDVSYDERIIKFALKADRADVIVPASITTLEIMRLSGATTIELPQVGIKDGILQELSSTNS